MRLDARKQIPAWLDDVIDVTKCSRQKHMDELIKVRTKLESAGIRMSQIESERFKSEID